MEIGSPGVHVYDNGLVRLRLTALREGEPTSIVSQDDLKEIIAFVEDDDDDDLEDVPG